MVQDTEQHASQIYARSDYTISLSLNSAYGRSEASTHLALPQAIWKSRLSLMPDRRHNLCFFHVLPASATILLPPFTSRAACISNHFSSSFFFMCCLHQQPSFFLLFLHVLPSSATVFVPPFPALSFEIPVPVQGFLLIYAASRSVFPADTHHHNLMAESSKYGSKINSVADLQSSSSSLTLLTCNALLTSPPWICVALNLTYLQLSSSLQTLLYYKALWSNPSFHGVASSLWAEVPDLRIMLVWSKFAQGHKQERKKGATQHFVSVCSKSAQGHKQGGKGLTPTAYLSALQIVRGLKSKEEGTP